MQLPQPYLFTSPRTVALVDQPQMAAVEGPIADTIYGFHTFWAAEVPFIPAHVSKDDRDFDTEATNRISQAVRRQVRFLYDLAQCRDNLSTFELRFVAQPQSDELTRVGIVFLGKTFHPNEQMSRRLALELWEKFSAVFPREVPFSYPLIPVREVATADSRQTRSFHEWYEPIPFQQLTDFSSIVELRKYEDWPTLRNIGGVYHAHDYIPHPFVPALDYSAMARLFETMTHQEQACVVSITIRPQALTDQEELILHEHARWFERVASGEVYNDNPLADVMHELKNDVFDAYPQAHAEQGAQVYNTLKRECRSLLTVRLQVIGTPIAQGSLLEALGSEVMANAGNAYPSRWTRVEAADANEFRWARFNLQWLEFARWQISPFIQQAPAIARLRQLATVTEVSGAFRLPVAPSSGGLAGLDVRDEPFSLPSTTLGTHASGLTVGTIMDRGVSTRIPYIIQISALSGLTQLFGDAGVARTHVLLQLLASAKAAGIPWLFLASTHASCTDMATQLQVRHILLDASSQQTMGLYPFLPPPGIALSAFVDALVRVFMAVYTLDATTGSLLRRAFLATYESAGWTQNNTGQPITLTDLATEIELVSRQDDVPMQTATVLRTRCVLALRDLIVTAPHLCVAPQTQTRPGLSSAIIEIGWVGSDTSNALLRGCLWAWFALARTALPLSTSATRGFIVLEDAHTLFSAAKDRPDSSNTDVKTHVSSVVTLAQSIAHAGIGTMLIENRPDFLSTEVTQKAEVTLLTANATLAAQTHAANLIGASPRQRQRMYHLLPTEAVVTMRGDGPVLVHL